MTFDEFIESRFHNSWVEEPGLRLYVRKSQRFGITCVDIGSVTAEVRGIGSFTAFLDRYEKYHNIYVESILEPRLVPFLERRGYTSVGDSLGTNMLRKCDVK